MGFFDQLGEAFQSAGAGAVGGTIAAPGVGTAVGAVGGFVSSLFGGGGGSSSDYYAGPPAYVPPPTPQPSSDTGLLKVAAVAGAAGLVTAAVMTKR